PSTVSSRGLKKRRARTQETHHTPRRTPPKQSPHYIAVPVVYLHVTNNVSTGHSFACWAAAHQPLHNGVHGPSFQGESHPHLHHESNVPSSPLLRHSRHLCA